MTHVTIDITINRPAPAVFVFIANFENNPQWQDGMVRCTFTTPGPLAVGSRYDQEAQFLGRPIRSTFEVVALEPGRMVKATTIAGSFPITFQRRVTPLDDQSCRIQAVIEGDAGGFFRLFAPLLDWLVARSIRADYARLKRLLEQADA